MMLWGGCGGKLGTQVQKLRGPQPLGGGNGGAVLLLLTVFSDSGDIRYLGPHNRLRRGIYLEKKHILNITAINSTIC